MGTSCILFPNRCWKSYIIIITVVIIVTVIIIILPTNRVSFFNTFDRWTIN